MLTIFQLHRLINHKAGKTAKSTCEEFDPNALAQSGNSAQVWQQEDTGLRLLNYKMYSPTSTHEHACHLPLAIFLRCLILHSLSDWLPIFDI